MLRTLRFPALALAAAVVAYVAGCDGWRGTSSPSGEKKEQGDHPQANAKNAKEDEHGHKPGGHGGNIIEIGRDKYHAEAVFEKGGGVRLYTLGNDEAIVQEVESQTLTAYIKPEGGTESIVVELKPLPQPGDTEGKTSLFFGQLPKDLQDRKVEVTVPSMKIAGERFRIGFKNVTEAHEEGTAHKEEPMPAKVADDAEKKLYLTAGGKYTEADIKANGNMTASQKFKSLKAAHDLKPKPGDKICPITLTKASPNFTWVVDGKTYEFCCPPCVDEFVQNAKENPTSIKKPGDYVKGE
jgi:YHS domain-containing protein